MARVGVGVCMGVCRWCGRVCVGGAGGCVQVVRAGVCAPDEVVVGFHEAVAVARTHALRGHSVGGRGWVWMDVRGCGWAWMGVSGCGWAVRVSIL